MIKLIAIDLDDTLLNKKKELDHELALLDDLEKLFKRVV